MPVRARAALYDTTRQRNSTANLVYKPAETITELSTFSDLSPGDVLLTGTPAGCARSVRIICGRATWCARRLRAQTAPSSSANSAT
jgi:2-keto-4-pentenoate hydratase/2-oxohepta-3-ene-1,7-dioic acid hydratase in catechol pathway